MPDPASVSHSEGRTKLESDDSEVAWTVLADHIGAFCQIWDEAKTPPTLSDYAPDRPSALRRLTLIELVKVDLENRWQRKLDPQRIEEYVQLYPELAESDRSVPTDLIYEEYHVRRQFGDAPAPEDYVHRFPAQAEAIRRLLGADVAESTALFSGKLVDLDRFGDSIDDFDLLTKLGKGAFGSVYLAKQRSMQRLVALKITATRSFEGQTLAQLDHPHIVRVHDERDLPEQGVRLLYMQYVAGTSLDQLIKAAQTRPQNEWLGSLLVQTLDAQLEARGESVHCDRLMNDASWTEIVCGLGIQLASALDYAHLQGVLHRDVKPANILLDASGASKLVDFNISYCSKLDGVTPAAYFGGSLAYMSPEQMLACHPDEPSGPDNLDARSDIYSLAVVLWELLLGARPFYDESVDESWPRTLEAAIARRSRCPDAAPFANLPFAETGAVARVLCRCLRPDPNDRYATAAEVARQLRLCCEPETRRLLDPPRNWVRKAVCRRSMPILLLLILLPNMAAGVFNFVYNDLEIIRQFPDARNVFWRAQLCINGTAFPVGLLICTLVAWPVTRACRMPLPLAAGADRWRRRSLSLGHWGALLGIFEWMLAGVAYPIAIQLAGISLLPHHYLHFIASLGLCGMIAATYPFFLITSVSIQHLYPHLVVGADVPSEEIVLLKRVHRHTWPYLGLAAVLPLAGIALLVLLGHAQNRFALSVLSLGGLAGFIWIFGQARRLQRSLDLLVGYVESANEPLEALAEATRNHRR